MVRRRGFGAVVLLILVSFLTQACATGLPGAVPASQRVIVYPANGQSAAQVSKDTAECEAWAQQATGYKNPVKEGLKEGLTWGAIGAAGGAVVGVLLGAIVGDPGLGAALGAVVGGSAGGLSQGLNTANSQQGLYERAHLMCMSQRGYAVSQ